MRGERGIRGARGALAAIALGALLVLAAFGSAWVPSGAPQWGVWCMIAGSALVMSATMALGALRSGVRGVRTSLLAAFLLIVIAGGFGVPMLLPAETVNSRLFLGLPLRVAIEIIGVGLLPVVVLPMFFAMEFRADGLDDLALADLRGRVTAMRRGAELKPDDH